MALAVGSFLRRLRRDVRANTLAIVAAALVPLAGMVGGGLDISRLYLTKTRLQHACDAGALAGRKAMGGGSWNTAASNVAAAASNVAAAAN
ncbi:MAG: pilus assembly protein TadG-related protein, partial [Sphingomonas bacterium]|nr:pilus assembly protein TadG-related protein [Sphingomonas bacterium]